ncbi:MAG: type IV secretory system conjugative DNA transfer family protein [Thermoanaerobaculia bacterium]
MSFLDFVGSILHRERRRAYEMAVAAELPKLAPPKPSSEVMEEVRGRLAGPGALTFGRLPSGQIVRVKGDTSMKSALVIGAPGSGKTRFLLGLLIELISRALRDEVEIELVDPKTETYSLTCQILAALYLGGDSALREAIRRRVRVIDWSREAVSPVTPFDNTEGIVSNAYLAHLRTDATVQASPQTYTESLKQALFMLSWLLTEKGFPPNLRFVSKLYSDPAFRAKVIADVAEPDLRNYFAELERHMARPTADALLRRFQHDLSFPEVRLSIGIPPASLRNILPAGSPRITLGNYGSGMALPASVGKERAAHRVTDVLLRAPRRNPKRPGLLFLEEAPTLLAGGSELVEPLTTAARTLRSVGFGVVFCGQDVANALPGPMVRTLQLNTWWWAIFRSHEEADWIYPHLLVDEAGAALSEGDRQKEFRRLMVGLPSRKYFLHVKGEPALPMRAPTVNDPSDMAKRSEAELLEVFRREIASVSMVPAKTAADLIARFEAEVVDRATIPPAPPKKAAPKGAAPVRGIADLLRMMGGSPGTGA